MFANVLPKFHSAQNLYRMRFCAPTTTTPQLPPDSTVRTLHPEPLAHTHIYGASKSRHMFLWCSSTALSRIAFEEFIGIGKDSSNTQWVELSWLVGIAWGWCRCEYRLPLVFSGKTSSLTPSTSHVITASQCHENLHLYYAETKNNFPLTKPHRVSQRKPHWNNSLLEVWEETKTTLSFVLDGAIVLLVWMLIFKYIKRMDFCCNFGMSWQIFRARNIKG